MNPAASSYLSLAIDAALSHLAGLYTEAILVAGLVIGLILAVLPRPRALRLLPWWTGVTLLLAFLNVVFTPAEQPAEAMLQSGTMARWFQGVALLVALALLYPLAMDKRLQSESDQRRGERFLLLLTVVLGTDILIRSTHVMMAYLGMELISLSSYALVAFTRREPRSAEAGVKFFIYGATASGFFLYGASWLYGLSGTLSITDPAFAAGLADTGLWMLPLGLMMVGILFKLGAFPMHFWMPDAWEGGTYPVSALLSILPKTAIMIFLIRLVQVLMPLEGFETVRWGLGLLAIVSMTWGNLSALRQTHMRRLLAYSGVAHAGFLLMAVAIATPQAFQAVMFYLTVYAVMNVAIFLMADGFHRGMGHARWQEWEGRGRLFPWATASLAVILASLTGLPPSGGFIAKWMLFVSGLELGTPMAIALVIAGAINTVLALAYYMIIPSRMVFRPTSEGDKAANEFPPYEWAGGMLLGFLLLLSGIWGFDKLLSLFASWF